VPVQLSQPNDHRVRPLLASDQIVHTKHIHRKSDRAFRHRSDQFVKCHVKEETEGIRRVIGSLAEFDVLQPHANENGSHLGSVAIKLVVGIVLEQLHIELVPFRFSMSWPRPLALSTVCSPSASSDNQRLSNKLMIHTWKQLQID